ncbi:MarR family winged helix-turn-helix transcriptional regulator [Agilicoccus flavus]|uniref:MarR family winged helix-turn-helix transcriptional regulator n=1 Tax=Agilicoccus flavus TaxID=2775968 RepID=UPI001CF711B0|nr:MarR family transcriptional regulator [Agilicoccus flavus]
MDTEDPWLSDSQQRTWRRWLTVERLLPAALARDLQAGSGLSLPDFEVLVGLTESPDGRLRVGDLAQATGWERSRVSHQVTRMENRGLVRRRGCAEDRRGAFVHVTDAGRAAIEAAAPAHARAVRRLVFDALDAERLEAFDAALADISEALSREKDPVDR